MLIRYGDDANMSQTSLACNTGEEGLFSNISANIEQDLPLLALHRPALLCGGGPSIADELENIRRMKAEGGVIYALNNTARFIAENGIKPDYQVILDPRPENIDFVKQPWADMLLLCSQAHPSLAVRARQMGYAMRLWHPAIPGMKKHTGTVPLVTVSLTAGLSTISLAHSMGHYDFHFFGYDCSHRDKKSHAYRQDMNAKDEIVRCCVDNQVFYASMSMAGQANQFKEFYDMMRTKYDCTMTVHGDGLLPAMVKSWQKQAALRVMTAVYDLGVAPPTYDFLTFLVEAERYRKKHGYDRIDLMLQPGPMNGFRDDDLPPDRAGREDMLWRVCAGMARLLPSVRNLMVGGDRSDTPGNDIFPEGYREDQPKAHYALAFLKGAEPMLRATEAARRQIKDRFVQPYATISLREATYWPDRNSNKEAWSEVARWLTAHGLPVVVVPDTNGTGLEGFTDFTPACFDIDLRAALYEGAVINLGVLNGPMSIIPYLKARYLIVKVIVETAVATTKKFLAAHGFNEGDDFGGNGRMIWKPDTAENIIAELQEFATQPKEKTP